MNEKPRPLIAPDLLAKLVEQAPSRVRRKLDKDPAIAASWDWSFEQDGWLIDSGKEQVSLEGDLLVSMDYVRCTCLLSPKCFHLLASITTLLIKDLDTNDGQASAESPSGEAEADEADEADGEDDSHEGAESLGEDALIAIGPSERSVVELLWREAGELLATGARAAGVLLQTQLLRAIHQCRGIGLHRVANAGQRVLQSVRQLRHGDADFQAEELVRHTFELLRALAQFRGSREGVVPHAWIGTARRPYRSMGGLRLDALLTEPICTHTGYAGVVSYFLSTDGAIATVSCVRPGGAEHVRGAWHAPIDVGGISASHQQMAGRGLLIQKGTRSDDGRLGAGQGTRAVPVDGDGWRFEALQRRFAESLTQQTERNFARRNAEGNVAAGDDLLFFRGHVLGSDGRYLWLRSEEGRPLRLASTDEQVGFHYASNLEMLAHAPGLRIACAARMALDQPGTASPLAIAGWEAAGEIASGESTLALPKPWGGRADLGLRKLQRHMFSSSQSESAFMPPQVALAGDGLERLRRGLLAISLGGRRSLNARGLRSMAREARQLERQLQPTAAALLSHLGSLANETRTGVDGLRFSDDHSSMTEAWLAMATYEHEARHAFQNSAWNAVLETTHNE